MPLSLVGAVCKGEATSGLTRKSTQDVKNRHTDPPRSLWFTDSKLDPSGVRVQYTEESCTKDGPLNYGIPTDQVLIT